MFQLQWAILATILLSGEKSIEKRNRGKVFLVSCSAFQFGWAEMKIAEEGWAGSLDAMTPDLPTTVRRIKRFAPMQLGKMLAVLYGIMGLIFVPFILLMTLIPAMIPQQAGRGAGPPMALTAAFGLGMAVAAPIFYAVMGFLTGVIGGFVYNGVAKWIGGIEVEVE